MSAFIAKGVRGNQIIRLLTEHGPMSVRGLSAVLEPAIHPRRLRKALQRLGQYGVIEKHFDAMFRGAGVFYEMPKDLRPASQARRPELLHSEACAVWAERLKRLFPQAIILRDHQFIESEAVKRALILDQSDPDNRPDLIIMMRPEQGEKTIMVAVEIERHHKSEARLVQKLRRFARGTKLDGVVYLCPKGTIGRRVRMIYESRIVERSHQIKRYGMNFLLLAEGMNGDYHDDISIRNVSGDVVVLRDWMQVLRKIPRESRLDSDFKMRTGSGPHFKLREAVAN